MSWAAAAPASLEEDAEIIVSLVIPASKGCDLACPFCYIKQRREDATSTSMTAQDYVAFVENVAAFDPVAAICIQGYEPLLPESFSYTQEILAAGQRLGIATSLVTNGTHLRQHVPALSKLRPARIAVSLDSAEAAVHDKARGKVGAFDDALAGLRFAVSVPVLKKALVVTSVLMPKKRERLMGMPALLAELGIERWVVNALVKTGKDGKSGGPAGERGAILDDLLALKAEADGQGIDMVVDDEFGRLSDDDRARELMEIEALRIKRLVRPEGVYRLVPTGHCSKGTDILKPIHDGTPVWHPSMDVGEFLASMGSEPLQAQGR
jgi:sulfatase maturation enzyme AslB (radical SAM superfamily)